jgi:RHS repeat-associated protein
MMVVKASPNVHLDWSLDGTSGPFVLKRSLSFTFSNPVYLGPGQTTKTFDDAVLNNGQSYAYEAFRRTLTDTLYFYHDDHLGTPIAMTNTSGALVWRAEHSPFGEIYALTVGTITNNLRFPGQYYDGETGLAQNYFRDYNNRTGRYWEPDPIKHSERDPYPYTFSNPQQYLDPAGLSVEVCCRPAQIPGGNILHHLGVNHCWLKTGTKEAGMGPAWGWLGWAPIPGQPTKIVDESQEPSSGKKCRPVSGVDEDCVNRELQIGKPTGAWGITNNCNTLANDIVKKCSPKRECRTPAPPSPIPPQHWPGGFY